MNELKVYNERGMLVTKPFIFTSTGSCDFYASPNRISLIETAPVDDGKKSFYFNLTKDDDLNYELHMRVNPTRVIQTIGSVVTLGNSIKQFFSPIS